MDYGTLSPSENKGTLAGRGQRTRQLNGLASIESFTRQLALRPNER